MTQPRILIVDDSSSVRQGLDAMLTADGMCAVQAADGIEACRILQTQSFDLIITDLDMPNMDGFELCRRIKNNETTMSVPVLILSTKHGDRDIEMGFKVGASAYVAKQNALAELPQRIHELLHKAFFLKQHTILVVDDSMVILESVKNGLEREGFATATAGNGRQALDMMTAGPEADRLRPGLILTDLDMPEMDGRTLCRTLKANPELSSIPLVVMSSSNDRSSMLRMIQEGAASYIAKPFRVEQLSILLERLLSDHFRLMDEQNRRLESERGLLFASISSLITALEARDQYTRGHSESVAEIAVNIARQMDFPQESLDGVRLAGRLHDLGKIGVRDNVLLKEGKLTDEEFEHIKRHTIIVADILSPIPSMREIINGAKFHHERMDGSGYPIGLEGQDIPLMARIIAVADVYDAMTSDRPYRKGFPREMAFDTIREARGTKLCPDCVDAFFRWVERGE